MRRLTYIRRCLLIVLALFLASILSGCQKDEVVLISSQDRIDESGESFEEELEEISLTLQMSGLIPETESTIFVYICGAVNAPGVYELPHQARVYEGIEAALGFTEEAADYYINQASFLSDGQQVRVPTEAELVELPMTTALVGEEENRVADGLIDLNQAGKEELMTLPGIGEAKAEAIINYRESNGKFGAITELMNIEGIKEGVFNKLKDKVMIQ